MGDRHFLACLNSSLSHIEYTLNSMCAGCSSTSILSEPGYGKILDRSSQARSENAVAKFRDIVASA
jgi:hypothetical protein